MSHNNPYLKKKTPQKKNPYHIFRCTFKFSLKRNGRSTYLVKNFILILTQHHGVPTLK